MSKRSARARFARETRAILETGFYVTDDGRRVELADAVEGARSATTLYRHDDRDRWISEAERQLAEREPLATRYRVANTTTLAAAKRLVDEDDAGDVLCLNFASAKNAGGGYLNGSQAQEESLARASALVSCIGPLREMYDFNRGRRTCLYSDYASHAPQVPVFRDDDDRLLDPPSRSSRPPPSTSERFGGTVHGKSE